MSERDCGSSLESYSLISPHTVVQQTGEILYEYFHGLPSDLRYLATSTSRFIADATQGFLLSDALIKQLLQEKELAWFTGKNKARPRKYSEFALLQYLRRDLARDELVRLMAQRSPDRKSPGAGIELVKPDVETEQDRKIYSPPIRYVEAYALAIIIFGEMKHMGPQTQYTENFSPKFIRFPNSAPLSFPKDSVEMLDRLEELSGFVTKTVNGQITPWNLDNEDTSQRRALAFFQVGRDLPIREPLSLGEALDAPLN